MKKINKIVLVVALLLSNSSFYGQNLKIMTYNIRLDNPSDGENAWPNRKDYFTDQIQFYSPDIFGVQEATPNQVVDIASALPNYNKFGIGREEEGKGEASAIYYKKSFSGAANKYILVVRNTKSSFKRLGWCLQQNLHLWTF